MKSRSVQHFPKSMGPSRAVNSYANCRNWAKIKQVGDFMPVLVICKFGEDPIKHEIAITRTTFSPLCAQR